MRRHPFLAAGLIGVLALGGCQSMQNSPKQTMGTLAGAGLGALAGSQIGSGTGQMAAIAIGTLGGAYLGGEFGKSLDKADRRYMSQTTQGALESNPTGTTSRWQNPDSGHHGTVTPTDTFRTQAGRNCREFTHKIYVDGELETWEGTACRQSDGTWRLVDQQ